MLISPRFRVLLIALAVFAGLTAACSDNESDEANGVLDSASVAVSTEPEPATTAPTTEPAAPTVEVSDSDLDELAEIWQQMFTATGLPFEEREPALQDLGVLNDDLVEEAANLLFQSDVADAYTYPKFNRESDGTIRIDDCVIYQPMIWESVTHIHAGLAELNDDGSWTITGFNRTSRYCVPAELAQGALNGYTNYFEAAKEFWNPPNPDHPGIEATLTGPQLEIIPGKIAEDQRNGLFVLDKDTSYPEVVDVIGPDLIVISDCREIHPDSGVYDSNGDKLEETPNLSNRNRYIAEMQLTDDGWKTASLPKIYVDDDCARAPTPAGRTHI